MSMRCPRPTTGATPACSSRACTARSTTCWSASTSSGVARFGEGVTPAVRLDAEVETDRDRLRERLVEGAQAWLPLLDAWPEARLQGRIEYRRLAGEAVSLPFAATLAHVFNHGTHHRGQITAAITAMGHPCPEIDLVWMLQQESPRPMTTTLDIRRPSAHVAEVWLNRPEVRNAFNDGVIAELSAAFRALGADPALRAIVLGGHGKAFCAGADLSLDARDGRLHLGAEPAPMPQALADMLWTI